MPHFSALARVTPANIAVSDISPKTKFLGLTFLSQKVSAYLQPHFYVVRPKATEFDEITQPLGLLRHSRSFKVTDFCANRNLICDFLLLINSNLPPILHRFRDIAFEGYKIAIFGYPSCVQPLTEGSPGTISLKFLSKGQRWP